MFFAGMKTYIGILNGLVAGTTAFIGLMVGGSLAPAAPFIARFNAGRVAMSANSEVFALGLAYKVGDGNYWIGASDSATPDLIFSQVGGSERARLTDAGDFKLSGGRLVVGAGAGLTGVLTGDIVSRRAATTGAYMFGDNAFAYIFYNGSAFTMHGGPLLFDVSGSYIQQLNEFGIKWYLAAGSNYVELNAANTSWDFVRSAGTVNKWRFMDTTNLRAQIDASGIILPNACAIFIKNAAGAAGAVLQKAPDNNVYLDALEGAVIFRTGAVITERARLASAGGLVLSGAVSPATAAGQIGVGANFATSATIGTNGATPAQVAGYLAWTLNGSNIRIPYYNA